MKIIFSIVFIAVGLFAQAQNKLSGKITDSLNSPLQGVEVYAPKLHRGTTTNSDGFYVLNNIPSQKIQVVFSFIGFKSLSKTIDLDGSDKELNIILEESVFEMDEIIVSTPFNKLQSENTMKVEHKTIKQLQRLGATTLIEGVSKIAGVSQVSTGAGIGKPVIRGLSSNRVLVYAQGVRLENQQFGDEHGLGLNDNGVESVEIIKGPASLLYGSDALGGVLYFNPERYANSNTVSSNFRQSYFTNTLGSLSSLGVKASAEKFKFLTSASYATHSDYKFSGGDRVTNSRFNEFDIKSGVGFDLKNFSSDIRFNYSATNLGLPEEIGLQSTDKTPVLPKQKIDNYILSAHNHIYFERSKMDINLGYISNNRQEFEEEEGNNGMDPALHMVLNTFTYDLKYYLPAKKFETILGVQGLSQTNENKAEEILIPDARVNDIGLLLTSARDWENHYLQGGFRFDSRKISTDEMLVEDRIFEPIDKSFNSFTASLGYKTTLFKTVETRINLASGFRAPNLAELSSNGVHEGTNRFEIGNSNLSNEQNFQFDLSFEYKNEHIEVFANAFLNAINDYIFLTPTGDEIDGSEVFVYQQQNAELLGAEFGFHWHPHPLDWLHLESSYETVRGKQKNGQYLPLIPANKLNNTLRTEFKVNKWLKDAFASLNFENVFRQNNVSQFETPTQGYNLLHFSLGGSFNIKKLDIDVNINMNNILDESYISHLSRLKAEGVANMGRNIIFGLALNI